MTAITADDVLRGAIEVLSTEGWAQGEYKNEQTGCYCALGALMYGAGKRDGWGNAYDGDRQWRTAGFNAYDTAVQRFAAAAKGMSYWDIPKWNDDPDRTKAQVIAAMQKALEAPKHSHGA